MAIHNIRSPQQWAIIQSAVAFEGKTVLDLGCGYGDLLLLAGAAGADICGVEQDFDALEALALQLGEFNAILFNSSIEDFCRSRSRAATWDVIICFSVLPYLRDPIQTLRWIESHSNIALIECQYDGDGPGPNFLKTDADMQDWLTFCGLTKSTAIGQTLVEGRDRWRTIWLCQS